MICPFNDPNFDMPMDEPCPVCGALGYSPEEVEQKCVDLDNKPYASSIV